MLRACWVALAATLAAASVVAVPTSAPALSAAPAPTATAIGGSSELSVVGKAGNIPVRTYATNLVAHDGRFERDFNVTAYGTGDAIGHYGEAQARQVTTASPAALASAGSARAEAHGSSAYAVARNTVRTGFVPDRTGTWHLELHATFVGSECGTNGLQLQLTRDAVPFVANRVDCGTPRLDLSQELTLAAGTRYEYVASVFEQVREGAGVWTWDIALTPVADPSQPLRNVSRPTVRGVKAVGRRLTARPGAWEGAPASYRFRWLRDGTPIRGATARRYRLRPADRGHAVRVRVSAMRGDQVVVATSRDHRVRGRR